MSKIIDLYSSILEYVGLSSNKETGLVSINYGDKTDHILVNSKTLFLPIDSVLRNPPAESILFHPLAENTLRGESEVIQKLKASLNIRMNYLFILLVNSICSIVLNKNLHQEMSPDQIDLLTIFKDMDETFRLNLSNAIIAQQKENFEKAIIGIYLKKGGTYKGKKYSRVGIISFPFYSKLIEKGKGALPHNLRAKDLELLIKLHRYIFPQINEPEAYNYGSNSDVAPYLDALLNTSIKILGPINDFVDNFRDFLDAPEEMYSNSDWVDDFRDLTTLLPEIRKIPVQSTTVDNTPVSHQQQIPIQQQMQRSTMPQQQSQQPIQQPQAPIPQPNPAPYINTNTLGNLVNSFLNQPAAIKPESKETTKTQSNQQPAINTNGLFDQQPQYQQPQYPQQHPMQPDPRMFMQQPIQPQYQQPMQQPQQPQYQQPMQPVQQPQLVNTGRGLDFRSVMQTNPQLSMAPNAIAGMTPGALMALQQSMQPDPRMFMQNQNPMWNQGFQQPMQPDPRMFMQQPMWGQGYQSPAYANAGVSPSNFNSSGGQPFTSSSNRGFNNVFSNSGNI